MKMRLARVAGCAGLPIAIAIALAGRFVAAQEDPPTGGELDAPAWAIADPCAFAYWLFAELNRQGKSDAAGQLDYPKSDVGRYDDDRPLLWETWASLSGPRTQCEVFRTNGARPVPWEELVRPAPKAAAFVELRMADDGRVCTADQLSGAERDAELVAAERIEVRVNRIGYESILCQQLFSRERLMELFVDDELKKEPSVQLPAGSIVVKARWAPLGAVRDRTQYHWRTIGNEVYVLLAWHVQAKALPSWFWATYVHESEINSRPRVQFAGAGKCQARGLGKDKWEHYWLLGTQSAFVDTAGRATELANPVFESTGTSCVTCHAYAAITKDGKRAAEAHITGVPCEEFFFEKEQRKHLQTDLLFYLARRAYPD